MSCHVEPLIERWPGKSAREPGGIEQPAAYHMLDVAAVAERLLADERMNPPLRSAFALLVALHDLGKIGVPFRRMLHEGTQQVAGRHWEASEQLLIENDQLLAEQLGGTQRGRWQLYAAVAGHHGKPPTKTDQQLQRLVLLQGEEARRDATILIQAFCSLWPDASLAELDKRDFTRLSWWLAGLTTTADWIGSNQDWFAPQRPDRALADYWTDARVRASAAVRQAGLDAVASADNQLLDFAPRPMQAACAQIDLPDGPMLAFIEDETGAGKTEAALLLAQRMLLAGKGRGLFFALPTTATADAMFARVRKVIARMFGAPPNLALAHGRAGHSEAFRELRDHRVAHEDAPSCTDWLADNRRRALLAQVGVGTIDQALLSVLPTRHATLRHYGLASKILVVDEVHEMGEPYLQQELQQLLRAHRMAGGSAILLSATLPLAERAALIRAFGIDGAALSSAYPALTIAGGAQRTGFVPPAVTRGPVTVRRLDGADAAVDLLVEQAGRGAACVWIRDAVDDAIAAVRALRARGVRADLLHARFTLVDRLRIEQDALARFGKEGQGREGRVLVGTQVLESSLDLDFDVMVSDLAPMAALIQRAGRLWRHMALRPAALRPMPSPILHVVAPDPARVENALWLQRVLPEGAWVYPASWQWRTAQVLFSIGKIDAPAGLRALIEKVHGADADLNAPELPALLLQADNERIAKGYAAVNQARNNLVKLERGYREGGASIDDVDYPTRLGQEQQTLMLAAWRDDQLVSWAAAAQDDLDCGDAEFLSEVRASKKRLRSLVLPSQDGAAVHALTVDWPDWRRKSVVVCPVGSGGAIAPGLRYDGETGLEFTSERA